MAKTITKSAECSLTSKWLLDLFIYLNNNPSIFLNGCPKCGIKNALENCYPSDDPFAAYTLDMFI